MHDATAYFKTVFSIDYIVVGSDSGRIVILDYNVQKNVVEKVDQETFGKSGCRQRARHGKGFVL